MARTRDGLLDAAMECLIANGLRRLTMSAIAVRAGVSKGTLYNHFRTMDGVQLALIDRELDRVFEVGRAAAAQAGPGAALESAAAYLDELRVLRRAGALPGRVVLALSAPGPGSRWERVRLGVADLLGLAIDDDVVDLAVRWLGSRVAVGGPAGSRAGAARSLAELGAAQRISAVGH